MLDLYKTKRKREWIKIFPDGREVLNQKTAAGLREYRERTAIMAERQGWVCPITGYIFGALVIPTFDHERTRGGGYRDDRILHDDGSWRNAALSVAGQAIKGSRRYHWIKEGDKLKYVPMSTAVRNPPKGRH